ncbi:MAG TPA: antitoxin VapB family protein [Verrucomicrobiae bacterium]|nr:antitoxin VapB family protein [Verrucomicrobiae bacterium]
MAFKTLTISEEAHRRLKKHKLPGESFTQVILRELPEPIETAGEVLDYLKAEPPAEPCRPCAGVEAADPTEDDLRHQLLGRPLRRAAGPPKNLTS